MTIRRSAPSVRIVETLEHSAMTAENHTHPIRCTRFARPRRGAVVVLFVFALPVLLILAGLAINIAYIQLVRTEIQVANDAVAKAANRVFTRTGDMQQALLAAQDIASRNAVNFGTLTVRSSDLELGVATRDSITQRYSFTPGTSGANAMRVSLAKTAGTPSGPVRLLFPNLFGSNFADVGGGAVATRVELDVILVIDRSGSMAYAANEPAVYPPVPAAAPPYWNFNGPVPSPSRWLDTVGGVFSFLTQMQNSPQQERVSLVTYNNLAYRDVALTENYGEIANALAFYSNHFTLGGTNIGGGIDTAMAELERGQSLRPWAAKAIIVLTDGIHNIGSDPVASADFAGRQGVVVFTVTFALEADQSRMIQVAQKGGGLHFHATNGTELSLVFQEIARRMPTLLSR